MTTKREIRRELDALTEQVEKAAEERERAHRRAERTGEWRDVPETVACEGIGDIIVCTNTAVYLATRLGGDIYGYAIEDNPTAQMGEGEGGHDFLVVDGRWLVDFWARDVYRKRDLYDLEDPKDAKLVRKRYGPQENWTKMSPKDFRTYVRFIEEQ